MGLTRGATTALINDLKGHFHPVLLTYADWPGEEIRIHTGAGNLSWGGYTWLGAGKLVQFSAPQEAGGLATSEATVRVAATVENMLAERGKIIRNRNLTVWFATTTKGGGNILKADPVELFNGYFDSRTGMLTRADGGLAHDMVLGLGVGPSARASASITHSYEDQIAKYPGDTAGRHVQNANKLKFNPQQWPE
ncbi:MAG TPA: hypothetical protein ENH56_05680 [Roseobacter sp.]|uniref:Uncharacterized protein n=1 Tax=marine sediment metagenome TaxID=412755 RepID=A0A0F9SL44_9ZZZZ|nr:hypothetical protein [Roseobacter sp.]